MYNFVLGGTELAVTVGIIECKHLENKKNNFLLTPKPPSFIMRFLKESTLHSIKIPSQDLIVLDD